MLPPNELYKPTFGDPLIISLMPSSGHLSNTLIYDQIPKELMTFSSVSGVGYFVFKAHEGMLAR